MTFVTFENEAKGGSILVSALPWCLCVPNLLRLHQICLQILSGNHFKLTSMTFLTLKIRSRSRVSKLVFALLWGLCVPNFVILHQIFLKMISRNHFNGFKCLLWAWKWGQGHMVHSWSSPCQDAYVYQIYSDIIKYFFRYWAETIYQII